MTVAELTLASSSPRRRQLLEMLGIPVRVVPPNIPEVRREFETPVDYVERLAREKALSVPGELVLGADTTVVVRDAVLEKPSDRAEALRMLQQLQGRTHQVVTSVALVADEAVHQATDVLPLQPIIGGRYYDRFAKTEGAWRFTERRMEMDLFGNLSAHLLQQFGP